METCTSATWIELEKTPANLCDKPATNWLSTSSSMLELHKAGRFFDFGQNFVAPWRINFISVPDLQLSLRPLCLCWNFKQKTSRILCSVLKNCCFFFFLSFFTSLTIVYRSHWPCGLWWGSATDRLMGLRVRIPPEALMSVSCECCGLSSRGFYDGPIPRPEWSYRLCCVLTQCDSENVNLRRPRPTRAVEP